MGIHETRRANLRWLIENQYGGVAADLAKDLRIQPSQLSRIFSSNPKNQRNMGTKLARAVELIARQSTGWMDAPHRFDEEKQETPGKGTLVMFPGNKIVPILDYMQAWQWTLSAKPYPLTERTEVIWTSLDQLSDRTFGLVIEGAFAPRPSVCATGHPSPSRTLGLAASDSFCRDRPALRHTTSLSLARAFAQ